MLCHYLRGLHRRDVTTNNQISLQMKKNVNLTIIAIAVMVAMVAVCSTFA